MEALRHHCKQKQIPYQAKLEEEAEAEVENRCREGPEKPETACSTHQRKISGGILECSRNSPGRDREEPKTASAVENSDSS